MTFAGEQGGGPDGFPGLRGELVYPGPPPPPSPASPSSNNNIIRSSAHKHVSSAGEANVNGHQAAGKGQEFRPGAEPCT